MRGPDAHLEFFRTRLGRTQPRASMLAFGADLARTNLDVMWAALLATETFANRYNRPPKDPRGAVLAQYERIVAAVAQLFPVFFVFESAWRTFIATRLLLIYGGEGWWHEVRDVVAQGGDASGVAMLGSLPARGEVLRTLAHALGGINMPSNLSTTFELMEEASLRHLEDLIDRHWADMSHPFPVTMALGRPTSQEFGNLFARVRKARNDAYHHRVVEGRAEVVTAAERLVDLLGIHLGERVAAIQAVDLPPLAFGVVRAPRHD